MTSKAFELAQIGDAVTVSSNGEVGIGTGSDSLSRELTVKKNDQCDVSIVAATNQSAQLLFGDTDSDNRGIIEYNNSSDYMAFTTAGSEKLRISQHGELIGPANNNFDIFTGTGTGDMRFFTNSTQKFSIEPNGRQSNLADVSGHLAKFENQHSSSPDVLWLRMSNTSPDNNSQYFVYCSDSSTLRCAIWSDGDIDNHDNSYGGTSDQKLKQQITDASSQWEDIKALQVRKFKFNSDVETGDSDEHWRLGVIAQEVESAGMSGLVNDRVDKDEDGNALETTTKSVKYSVLYMKAVKALQEAMDRIETLEAENVAIKARLDALEAD